MTAFIGHDSSAMVGCEGHHTSRKFEKVRHPHIEKKSSSSFTGDCDWKRYCLLSTRQWQAHVVATACASDLHVATQLHSFQMISILLWLAMVNRGHSPDSV